MRILKIQKSKKAGVAFNSIGFSKFKKLVLYFSALLSTIFLPAMISAHSEGLPHPHDEPYAVFGISPLVFAKLIILGVGTVATLWLFFRKY